LTKSKNYGASSNSGKFLKDTDIHYKEEIRRQFDDIK